MTSIEARKIWRKIWKRMLRYNFHRNPKAKNDTDWHCNKNCILRAFKYIDLLDGLKAKYNL